MNVVNVDLVELFCERMADRTGRSASARGWMTRNLRRHILRVPEFHTMVDGQRGLESAVSRGLLDSPPDWLDAAMKRGDEIVAFDPSLVSVEALTTVCEAIADWLRATAREAPLDRMTVEDAAVAAASWHTEQTRRRVLAFAKRHKLTERQAMAMLAGQDGAVAALWPDDPDGVEPVSPADDLGLNVVRLLSEAALEREGTLLDHCVATYADRVEAGGSVILSVRDARNMPLATIELTPADEWNSYGDNLVQFLPPETMVMSQARGLSNSAPSPEARERVRRVLVEIGAAATRMALRSSGMQRWPELSLENRIDVRRVADRLMDGMNSDPNSRKAPSAAVKAMLSLAGHRLGELDAEYQGRLLEKFLPHPGAMEVSLRRRRVLARDVDKVTITLPVAAFSSVGRHVRILDEDAVYVASKALAEAAIAEVSRRPTAVIEIKLPSGNWPSPDAFFAYAGALPEWMEARRKNVEARRAFLVALSVETRVALRSNPDMPESDRASLMNFLNVEAPTLRTA